MARAAGEVFAKGSLDWPNDPRCLQLNNDTRWFDEVLWRTAVKERSEVIPLKYDVRYWQWLIQLPSAQAVSDCLKSMAEENLISFTTDTLQICVRGVRGIHNKLMIFEEAPEQTFNPWDKDKEFQWTGANGKTEGKPVPKKKKSKEKVPETDSTEPRQVTVRIEQFLEDWNRFADKIENWPKCSRPPAGATRTSLIARIKDDVWWKTYNQALKAKAGIDWIHAPGNALATLQRFVKPDSAREFIDGDWKDRKKAEEPGGYRA